MAYKNLEKKREAVRKAQQKYVQKMKSNPETLKVFLERDKKKTLKWKRKHVFVKLISWLESRLKSRNYTINGYLIQDKITPNQLFSLAKKQKLICPLSGRKLTTENISLDHIIPLARGGKNSIDNIMLVVKDANLAKQQLSTQEFIQLCKDVVKFNSFLEKTIDNSSDSDNIVAT